MKYKKGSHQMLKLYILLALSSISMSGVAAGLTISGSSRSVLTVTPDRNTGLDEIFVTYGSEGLTATFDYGGMSAPKWYRYSNLGGGFAEDVQGVINDGGVSTLTDIKSGYGYIIECGDKRFYYFLVDYLEHPLRLSGLRADDVQDCSATTLLLMGEGTPLTYYTINGQQRSLDRELSLTYETEEWDEDVKQFVKVTAEKSIANFSERINITPPTYCSTYFTLTGDKFLKAWGEEQSVESSVVTPQAIEVRASAEEVDKSASDDDVEDVPGSNEIGSSGGELGGSAPAEINFYAYCTEGVMHNEWQMAEDADFEKITYRITDRDLNFVFRDEGTVYVRFVGSNADGSCEAYSDVFTVSIGASELHCPNAFSPGTSEGVNDEWKVSYKSLVDFKCWIFDRYGTQMCYFDDPSKGWDGKYRGKLVKPGVYYYVIQATGSEGKKYKKSGDINIVRYKTYSTDSSATE